LTLLYLGSAWLAGIWLASVPMTAWLETCDDIYHPDLFCDRVRGKEASAALLSRGETIREDSDVYSGGVVGKLLG